MNSLGGALNFGGCKNWTSIVADDAPCPNYFQVRESSVKAATTKKKKGKKRRKINTMLYDDDRS